MRGGRSDGPEIRPVSVEKQVRIPRERSGGRPRRLLGAAPRQELGEQGRNNEEEERPRQEAGEGGKVTKRKSAVTAGLAKLAALELDEGGQDRVQFSCGQSHDALVGLLLIGSQFCSG